MDPDVQYLLSLKSIRERAKVVGEASKAGKLSHFDVHEDRLDAVADFVVSVIQRDYGPDKFDTIPPHGRWQHFEVGDVPRIANLVREWKAAGCDNTELTRRLIDLFFISVLLDAGAGDHWRYTEPGTEQEYERSEGIAVASLHMFTASAYTSGRDNRPTVDGKGLEQLATEVLVEGFQVSESNPMLGIDSRADLLRKLGTSLLAHPDVFGDQGRPGALVGKTPSVLLTLSIDYLLKTKGETAELDVLVLWKVLQTLLIPIWPKDRTTVAGHAIGDAWPLSTLRSQASFSESDESDPRNIQPFHKLTQWLTYSLMVPFGSILDLQWMNADSLTALPEYRNGGLFVDLDVLSLKKEALDRGLEASGGPLPLFEAGDDVIVEWRAMTLVLIDRLYQLISDRMQGVQLTMAQLLEAGTWKSGREIAAKRRPDTKSSPILIKSDGTVF
ncbi:DUF1688 domain-containing protein [Lophiotrema nucula]|uniref:DUF1688 domain-containing protein n=1 Tax=Lophiotrema nucula TaxID=690887 RepID=A0A6A5Z7I0_9PLEO|nr:DUF1688 domain-containing protein [Lophiotrema nucula]